MNPESEGAFSDSKYTRKTVGAVYDRAFFLESTKYARS